MSKVNSQVPFESKASQQSLLATNSPTNSSSLLSNQNVIDLEESLILMEELKGKLVLCGNTLRNNKSMGCARQ